MSLCGHNQPLRRPPLCALALAWLLALIFGLAGPAWALPLDFATFRLGAADNAVLVVGGIQGDEPGGFSAATLLATRYEITRGAVWVVPNLNFPSIIKKSRGLYGDMNRKFAILAENDPEYDTVRRIQELIDRPEVRLVLNLHDGSGFYRPEYQDKLRNPSRWGQSIIIDQENLDDGVFMGALGREARQAAEEANAALVSPGHAIHVHNTNTASGDHEMEKSLSYYAVRGKKAAFGLEASKEFGTATRAYYHLLMLESFLRMAGVEFTRDFDLSPRGVESALSENVGVSFAGNRIFLPLENARKTIKFLPLPRDCLGGAITSKPIMAVLPCAKNSGELCVHYGNRTVTLIRPEWREISHDLDGMAVVIDGVEKLAPFGQILDVRETALIKKAPGHRVNAIGFDRGLADESGVALRKKDFESSFSVDKDGMIYRVEVYKGKSLSGMFLLRFIKGGKKQAIRAALPDKPGPESSLGR